jgi:hypothetical protein
MSKTRNQATASAVMPLRVFQRVRRVARLEAGLTAETLPEIYSRWLIAGAGLTYRGGPRIGADSCRICTDQGLAIAPCPKCGRLKKKGGGL